MTLPSLTDIRLPLLRVLSDGQVWRVREASRELERFFQLTPEDLRETVSGGEPKFLNRVWWARSGLVKAGLASSPKPGYIQITELGLSQLQSPPERLSARYLAEKSPAFREFFYGKGVEAGSGKGPAEPVHPDEDLTPLERIDESVARIQRALRDQILERLHACSPEFFERLVVKVLVAMGYGGNLHDAGQAIGRSGDEGMDGVIKEDRLGLDKIYIQAKRWANSVGGPEIQGFIGALQMKNARKGVFITTSDFTAAAHKAVANLPVAVVLINGSELADFMIEHRVGVAVEQSFTICRLDAEFFMEEE